MARRVLTAVTDRPETAVRLSERLALSVGEAATAIGVSERLMRSVLPDEEPILVYQFQHGRRRYVPSE
jgi:hypothetical protein